MNKLEQIAVLEAHKQNILDCTTFEEFKTAQVSYIDLLIELFETEQKHYDIILNWIEVKTNV